MFKGLTQATVNVDDLDAAVASFHGAFGLEFTVADDPDTGGRIACSSRGVAIASRPANAANSAVAQTWNGPLSAVVVTVADLDGAISRFAAVGSQPVHIGIGSSGEKAAVMAPVHGLPFTLLAWDGHDRDEPAGTRLNRVVLAVDDIDQAAANLRATLGIELTIFDIENMRFRVGLGEDGIELIGKMDPVIEIERFWNSPIAGYVLRVDDLDEAKDRMAAQGAVVSHEFVTPGGMVEVFYGNPGLHGVPITVIAPAEGQGLMDAMGLDESERSVNTTLTTP
jgi:predicted enzyme related to lactoylglutathione lyase